VQKKTGFPQHAQNDLSRRRNAVIKFCIFKALRRVAALRRPAPEAGETRGRQRSAARSPADNESGRNRAATGRTTIE
jgi:hypothetical protein